MKTQTPTDEAHVARSLERPLPDVDSDPLLNPERPGRIRPEARRAPGPGDAEPLASRLGLLGGHLAAHDPILGCAAAAQ